MTSTSSQKYLTSAEIVRDEQIGQAELVPQPLEQADDLGLDRDVQRGRRLVQHEQGRLQRQRAGNADALLLAARHLVRIARRHLRVEPDHAEQSVDGLGLLGGRKAGALDLERLHHGGGDGVARIDRRIRVLEHHLHAGAQPAHLARALLHEVEPLEADAAAGRFDQPQDEPRQRRFPAAGFADHADDPALGHAERHVVHRVHGARGAEQAAPAAEPLRQVACLEQVAHASTPAKWQAAAPPGPGTKGGGTTAQTASARGQRG